VVVDISQSLVLLIKRTLTFNTLDHQVASTSALVDLAHVEGKELRGAHWATAIHRRIVNESCVSNISSGRNETRVGVYLAQAHSPMQLQGYELAEAWCSIRLVAP